MKTRLIRPNGDVEKIAAHARQEESLDDDDAIAVSANPGSVYPISIRVADEYNIYSVAEAKALRKVLARAISEVAGE